MRVRNAAARAQVALVEGDLATAERWMEQVTDEAEALELAAPEGYVRTFIDKGEAMAQLIRAAVARGVAADYAHRLLRAFAPAPPAGVDSALIEPLSPRELEVLQLLPTGRTNQEIAACAPAHRLRRGASRSTPASPMNHPPITRGG